MRSSCTTATRRSTSSRPRTTRWKPLYKWLLAVPHYVVLLALGLASIFVVLFGLAAVVVTGAYPMRARDFLVGV